MSTLDSANSSNRRICGIPVPLLFVVYLASIAAAVAGLIVGMAHAIAAPGMTYSFDSLSGWLLIGGLAPLLAIVALSTISWFKNSRFSLTEFWVFCLAAGAALGLTQPMMPFYAYSGLIAACGAFAAGIMMSGLLSLWTFSKPLRLTVLTLSAVVGSGFGQALTACAVIVGFFVAMPLLGFCVWRREQSPLRPGLFPRPPLFPRQAKQSSTDSDSHTFRLSSSPESVKE